MLGVETKWSKKECTFSNEVCLDPLTIQLEQPVVGPGNRPTSGISKKQEKNGLIYYPSPAKPGKWMEE